MVKKECVLCGSTEKLTRHHLYGPGMREGGPIALLCRSCHDKEHNQTPKKTPEQQEERLLKRQTRFANMRIKTIQHNSRWVHIADQWTDEEKKEMLEYLASNVSKTVQMEESKEKKQE
jgi:cytochrome c553